MLVYLRYTTKEGSSIEIHKGESLDPLFSKIPINKHLLKAVLKKYFSPFNNIKLSNKFSDSF